VNVKEKVTQLVLTNAHLSRVAASTMRLLHQVRDIVVIARLHWLARHGYLVALDMMTALLIPLKKSSFDLLTVLYTLIADLGCLIKSRDIRAR
jgi:hypothetical protein